MVAHRYGLDTAAFNFDRVVALYGNLGKEQQRGFLSDVNTVGGGLLRSLSRTLAVQTREPLAAEYAVAVPSAKKQSRQRAVSYTHLDVYKRQTPSFEKIPKPEKNSLRPKMQLIGQDGNIFAIMGLSLIHI